MTGLGGTVLVRRTLLSPVVPRLPPRAQGHPYVVVTTSPTSDFFLHSLVMGAHHGGSWTCLRCGRKSWSIQSQGLHLVELADDTQWSEERGLRHPQGSVPGPGCHFLCPGSPDHLGGGGKKLAAAL